MARSERPSFSFAAASITSGRSSAMLLPPSHLPRPSSVTRSFLARLRSRAPLSLETSSPCEASASQRVITPDFRPPSDALLPSRAAMARQPEAHEARHPRCLPSRLESSTMPGLNAEAERRLVPDIRTALSMPLPLRQDARGIKRLNNILHVAINRRTGRRIEPTPRLVRSSTVSIRCLRLRPSRSSFQITRTSSLRRDLRQAARPGLSSARRSAAKLRLHSRRKRRTCGTWRGLLGGRLERAARIGPRCVIEEGRQC